MRWALLTLIATPLWAECPPAADHSKALAEIFDEARAAQDPAAGQVANSRMWELWLDAPDEAAQEVLDKGMRQRESYDFAGSIETMSTLIAYCPDYAEGYNQRAFALYLQGNYADALPDLDKALELSPNHVGAQSGRALTLMNLQRITEARTQMLEALENNPWLSERALLAPGGPLHIAEQEI